MTRRYLRPRNLTWWAGVAALALGVALILWPSSELTEIGRVIALLVGAADASPAVLIVTGLGLIGLNDKFERERERGPDRWQGGGKPGTGSTVGPPVGALPETGSVPPRQ